MNASQNNHFELLLVDDDDAFRETLRALFEPRFRLIEANCGEEALEIVKTRRIDLALFDMHMRLLTGLETVRLVREFNARLPTILITARPSAEIVREAEQLAVYRVLPKPIRRDELFASVNGALRAAYPDRSA